MQAPNGNKKNFDSQAIVVPVSKDLESEMVIISFLPFFTLLFPDLCERKEMQRMHEIPCRDLMSDWKVSKIYVATLLFSIDLFFIVQLMEGS